MRGRRVKGRLGAKNRRAYGPPMRRFLAPLLALSFVMLGSCGTADAPDREAPPTVEPERPAETYRNGYDLLTAKSPKVPEFEETLYDLNSDGRMERIIYVIDACNCGTGGCGLMVLTPVGDRFELVGDISLGWPPIEVLETTHQGWRDLSVHISGGGATPHRAALPFDGKTYPSNASMPPAYAHNSQPWATLFKMDVLDKRDTPFCVSGNVSRQAAAP